MAKKKIGVTLEAALHQAVKARAAELGRTTEWAYEQALTRWLKKEDERKQSDNALSDDESIYVRQLLAILRSGYTDACAAVRQNLDVFHRYARGGKRTPGKD